MCLHSRSNLVHSTALRGHGGKEHSKAARRKAAMRKRQPDSTSLKDDAASQIVKTPNTAQPPPASLLTIALELRNRIYAVVLLVSTPIEVTPVLHEPSLLSASRQIRSEARKMWFIQNAFLIPNSPLPTVTPSSPSAGSASS
ncbi:unnamed protein product [Zymoseptoria tritici ST99CH_3D7]|uniref:Uncharacterized protein n=1 Tax=Zymoseptoria tritici (strain ST99CH_3D7) TaxID=1276538 RepID=A0A1X7RDQ9_ZYMT9|nr:unnamed protein product [Zymoseptoria tritici ST99CH_3D7]